MWMRIREFKFGKNFDQNFDFGPQKIEKVLAKTLIFDENFNLIQSLRK